MVIGGERDVGEQRVAPDHLVGIAVGLRVGARDHPEVARLGIDGPQPPVRAGMEPCDVIAHREHFPAGQGVRRNQHREVGLAAGGGKGCRHVVGCSARIAQADDEHVLGEPAFRACLPARHAQRVALLAEQRVAAVAGAVALDRELLRKVHDEAPVRVELPGRVQPAHKRVLARDALECLASGAGHDQHVDGDVGAVGDLDAAARERRVDRAHAVGNHVQRASAHAPAEQLTHLGMRGLRFHPVVVRAGVVLRAGADVGQVLDPRHVGRIGAVQVAVRIGLRIELEQLSFAHQGAGERLALGPGALAPVHALRLRQLRDRIDPVRDGTAQLRHRNRQRRGSGHARGTSSGVASRGSPGRRQGGGGTRRLLESV